MTNKLDVAAFTFRLFFRSLSLPLSFRIYTYTYACVCVCDSFFSSGAPFDRISIGHTRSDAVLRVKGCEIFNDLRAMVRQHHPQHPQHHWNTTWATHVCKVVVMHGGTSLGQRLCIVVGGAREEMIPDCASNLLLILIARIALPAGVLQNSCAKSRKS